MIPKSDAAPAITASMAINRFHLWSGLEAAYFAVSVCIAVTQFACVAAQLPAVATLNLCPSGCVGYVPFRLKFNSQKSFFLAIHTVP